MKNVFLLATLAILAACNSGGPASTSDLAKASPDTIGTQVAEIKSPYQINYSSKFVLDDPKNAETVLNLWNDWDKGDLMVSKDRFADSVTMNFADGTVMHGSRDSLAATMQAYRNTLASAVSQVNAVMALKSTDKNESWALIWGMEKDTDKKGKVDSFYLQETWRFNKEGKADLVYQFKAEAAAPKKK